MVPFNLRKTSSVILVWALFFLFGAWKAEGKEFAVNNVFDHIRPAYDLVEFISNSEFVEDYESVHENLLQDLDKQQIHLQNLTSEKAKKNTPGREEENLHFASKDGVYSLEILQHTDGAYLYKYWKTSLKELGLKAEIQNDEGGNVYLKVKTVGKSALGATFYTGRNVFRIAIKLPFSVPETYEELDSAKQLIVNNKFKELYLILDLIAKHYVLPSEFVFFPTHENNLTRDQRMYGFIQFWTEVKYNFAFFDQVPDLNWDRVLVEYLPLFEKEQSLEEYYNNMKKMCALLKDGHTNVYPPFSVESAYDRPPIQLVNIQNKAIVENIALTLEGKIPLGSEIIEVDGMATENHLEHEVLPYISSSTEHILYDWGIRDLLRGKKGTSVKITFRTPAGNEKQLELERDSKNSQLEWVKQKAPWKLFEFKRLAGDVAYVALNSFGSDEIVQAFRDHIDTIRTCKGLIIDLRANGGGNSMNGYEIIKHLTEKPFLTSTWRTRDHRPAYKAWGRFHVHGYRNKNRMKESSLGEWEEGLLSYYKGEKWHTELADTIFPAQNEKISLPLAVLIGHNTASAAEDFLIALDHLKIATVIGDKTFGSTGQPLMMNLPGGGLARICTKRDEYPDGRQFVGFGIEPDVYVQNTIEDLLLGTDATLKMGEDIIAQSIE